MENVCIVRVLFNEEVLSSRIMFGSKFRKLGSLFGGSELKNNQDSGSEPKKRFACPSLLASCLVHSNFISFSRA